MRINIGEMREPVAILTMVRSVDESGGDVITYVESDPLFVSIRALTTNEQVQFGQMSADVTNVCFGHYEALNSLDSTNRIRHIETGIDYDINGTPINDPLRAWTRLNLVARENG